jgi:hypothetical protein
VYRVERCIRCDHERARVSVRIRDASHDGAPSSQKLIFCLCVEVLVPLLQLVCVSDNPARLSVHRTGGKPKHRLAMARRGGVASKAPGTIPASIYHGDEGGSSADEEQGQCEPWRVIRCPADLLRVLSAVMLQESIAMACSTYEQPYTIHLLLPRCASTRACAIPCC